MKLNYLEKQDLNEYEDEGRYIASRLIEDIFAPTGFTIKIENTVQTDAVDLHVLVMNPNKPGYVNDDFYVEVKTRFYDTGQPDYIYQYARLKQEKLENIKKFTDKVVWYISVATVEDVYKKPVNHKAYLYNLNYINWQNIPLVIEKIKETQVAVNSPTKDTPMYHIPYSLSTKYDAQKYYDDWNAINKK